MDYEEAVRLIRAKCPECRRGTLDIDLISGIVSLNEDEQGLEESYVLCCDECDYRIYLD